MGKRLLESVLEVGGAVIKFVPLLVCGGCRGRKGKKVV